VPNKRKVNPARRAGIDVRWRDLGPHDVYQDLVTRPALTVITCARERPFDAALAVADSARRHADVTKEELLILAERQPRGRDRCRRVALAASEKAANPFESVLRAIALDVPGVHVEPQIEIDDRGFWCRPDLVDVENRIVIEAESFEFHSSRKALLKDCRRYTSLTIRGWRVVRFCWEDVMFYPEYVRLALLALIDPTAMGPEQQALLTRHLLRSA
jgi:very-short-patch-repair endonuclease